MATNKLIQWKTEKRKLSELIPNAKNARKITDKRRKQLEDLLNEIGLAEIPAINTDNTILAGHQRIVALLALYGDIEIDVRVPPKKLTAKQADKYLVGSNLIRGEFDNEALRNIFSDEELVQYGFDEDWLITSVNYDLEK